MNNFLHNPNSTPPAFPPVVESIKRLYKSWIPVQRNLPKGERFGLGQKIDHLFIELLETLHRASFTSVQGKLPLLSEALLSIDSLRFFLQLGWELKLIPTNQYSVIGQEVETIGKMVGGWRKGLVSKTSQLQNREEKS